VAASPARRAAIDVTDVIDPTSSLPWNAAADWTVGARVT